MEKKIIDNICDMLLENGCRVFRSTTGDSAYVVTRKNRLIFISKDNYSGVNFTLEYAPSVKSGTGCRCNEVPIFDSIEYPQFIALENYGVELACELGAKLYSTLQIGNILLDMYRSGHIVEILIDEPYRFNYMLLSRLQRDCEYFLGFGGRSNKHLWAETPEQQIEKMVELYNSFPEMAKPTWLNIEKIEEYRRNMTNE